MLITWHLDTKTTGLVYNGKIHLLTAHSRLPHSSWLSLLWLWVCQGGYCKGSHRMPSLSEPPGRETVKERYLLTLSKSLSQSPAARLGLACTLPGSPVIKVIAGLSSSWHTCPPTACSIFRPLWYQLSAWSQPTELTVSPWQGTVPRGLLWQVDQAAHRSRVPLEDSSAHREISTQV